MRNADNRPVEVIVMIFLCSIDIKTSVHDAKTEVGKSNIKMKHDCLKNTRKLQDMGP